MSAAALPAFLLSILVVFLVLSAAATPARAAAARGIVDNRLEYHGGISLAPVPAYAEEMGSKLGAQWTRIFVYWDQLEPKAPWQTGSAVFDRGYLNELDTVVGALRDQGMNVILTGSDPPAWARDTKYKKYWTKNPTTAVIRTDTRVLNAFTGFAKFVAQHFGQNYGVKHFEVWNEPNLRLLPQVVGKKVVGPEVYRKMLIAFSKGARAGNKSAVVIAGATSRMGSSGTSSGSTSPQWFAKYLKARGAAKWFQAYSHHPYSTRMSDPSPSAKPRRPDISVTLGNLPVLLKLFPTKDFYLTEYCYSTSKNDAFVLNVSKADQARYLREAYALVNTSAYRQVKTLLWFLVQDWQTDPGNPESLGVYTGLVEPDGQRKPSWWAFAGGNALAVSAPASVAAGASFDITGTLTTKEGAGAGISVRLQRRSGASDPWDAVQEAQKTLADGTYGFTGVKQSSSMQYRVIWDGVCESSQTTVGMAQ